MRNQRVLLAVLIGALALILAVNLGAGSEPAADAEADLAAASRGGAVLGATLPSVVPSLGASELQPALAALARKKARAAALATAQRKAQQRARRKAAKQRAAQRRQAEIERTTEVWQRSESAYRENPDNPLAGRVWGVYRGPQDQVSSAYDRASSDQRAELDTIMKRPRTKWYGSFVPDGSIRSSVDSYIAASQNGDRSKLVQFAVFRMEPWEHEACGRASSQRELDSYRRWIDEMAAAVGSTPTLIVMQPDGPFLLCSPDRAAKGAALTHATRTLSALPNTSVYIDAGAADWCQNDAGANPETCASILKQTGIRYARGFALDSTHYTGPIDNIRHGSAIVDVLRRDGYGRKHFIIDTAKSGRPTLWNDVIASRPGGLKDDAQVCRSAEQTRCVTLGIPPTTKVAEKRFGFSGSDRALARRHVDGFVWFGRPWLYKQADPFVMDRALTMVRSTPWEKP